MKKEVHALLKSGRELLSKAKLHQTRKISRGLEVLQMETSKDADPSQRSRWMGHALHSRFIHFFR